MFLLILFGSISICQCILQNDPTCFDNCECCLNRACHSQYGSINVCSDGCIDGHRGARCYELCPYENCKSCGHGTKSRVCDACYDGFYLGPDKDCKNECPASCESCRSSTNCTGCKEGYFDTNDTSTCYYFKCPINCICNETNCIEYISDAGKGKTVIAVSTSLAVGVVLAVAIFVIIWKNRSSRRNRDETTTASFENKPATVDDSQGSKSVFKISIQDYEKLRSKRTEKEHEYQDIA